MTDPALPTLLVLVNADADVPESAASAWLAELPPARRTRLEGWRDTAARRRSLLGTRLLREGLVRLGYPADALVGMRESAHGRPSLELPLDFSIAHCEGRILCALSTTGPVGVDVEAVGKTIAAEFRLYLTPLERERAGDDPRRFHSVWTQKEAVAKAAGERGLAQLRDFEVLRGRATFAGQKWRTAKVPVGRGFVAHVAQGGAQPAPEVVWVAMEEILRAGPPSPGASLG